MTESPCSPEQLDSRETVTFDFVPFVVRLFSEGPLRGGTPAVMDDPNGHTAESMHRLREIWKRAAWRFLARDCGWRALPGRIWETQVPPLRFTADSMKLCLALYGASRTGSDWKTTVIPACQEATGDLILHHLAFRRLRQNPLIAGLPSSYDWSAWNTNPLNTAADPLIAPAPLPPEAWDLLTAEPFAPLLPWILSAWTLRWDRTDSDESEPPRPDSWRRWQAARRRVVDGIMDAFGRAARPQHYLPFLEWFARMAPGLPRMLQKFEDATRSMPLAQRPAACADWHHMLGHALTLQSLAEEFTAIHPADREPCHRTYLAAVHSSGFAEALPAIRSARQALRPVIS